LELTGGNPLQVRELVSEIGVDGAVDLDGSVERAARSLSRSVLRRLGVLSGDAQAVARAVAVFETDVELHLAAALAERVPASALAAVDELARADILAAADPLRFVHPLLRAAVYGALPRHERGAIHRRAARLLAAQGATSEQVAVHLLEAAPVADPEAVEALRRAAGSAMAHGVPASAIRYLERAIREPPADDLRPQLLAELARAELAVGRRDAIAHLEAAIELAGDPSDRARFRLELGRALHDFGRPDEACAALERGAAELDGGDRDLVVDLESWYLTSAMVVPERAADAHRRAQAIISRADRAATRAERALVSKAMIMHVYSGGTCEQVASIARQLFAGGRLLEEDGVASQALGHVAGTLSYCDRYADVEDVLARTLEHCRRRGLVTWVAMSLQLRARQRLWTGSLPDAVEDARIAFETLAGGLQMYLPATGYCLARGLIEQDHPDEAAQVLAAVDAGPPPRSHFAAWRHEAAGRLAAHRADHERALESFLAAGDCLRGVRVTNPAMFHWRSEAGLAALQLDRRDLARALIDEELELAERFGAPRAIGVARRASGLLERGETAVATLRSAAEALEACGARVEHARALAELGAAVRRAGRPGDARTALREAIRLAEELGARTVARQARDELKRAGGRAPAERDAAGDLTPSERRVAELAAAGRSNREIANELFVTVKAVEWHLGNVYRKLDVRGRGELAGAL
jgi:DNA-binding CsgD family transcriptional regulator